MIHHNHMYYGSFDDICYSVTVLRRMGAAVRLPACSCRRFVASCKNRMVGSVSCQIAGHSNFIDYQLGGIWRIPAPSSTVSSAATVPPSLDLCRHSSIARSPSRRVKGAASLHQWRRLAVGATNSPFPHRCEEMLPKGHADDAQPANSPSSDVIPLRTIATGLPQRVWICCLKFQLS
ncbi:hypothetical protein E2562_013311 [Oryza meyeriana var. granulata]|uniref:Uncharacterized protein n=2 Tax=Oryza meyeriana var. granulata TaxID=110450 RepID=A0A6G1D2L2_9ORYZ|nr:hypothetical protein E2562_013311 [Oryza meyeriana var. granulata]